MKFIYKMIFINILLNISAYAGLYSHGQLFPGNSTINTNEIEVEADNQDSAIITVHLKDVFSDAITNADVVLLQVDENGLSSDSNIGPVDVSDRANGNYRFTVKSSVVESVRYTARATATFIVDNTNMQRTSSLVITDTTVLFTPPGLPYGVRLDGGKVKYITSIFDKDYAPYTRQHGPATRERNVPADYIMDTLVNIQGSITQQGVVVEIPYNANNGVILPAYKAAFTVPIEYTEDNTSRRLYFEYPTQSLSSKGVVRARIYTSSGTLLAKKLDINVGIGDGSDTVLVNSLLNTRKSVYGVLLGKFPMAINSSGDRAEVQARTMIGIPDRTFGKPDGTGNANSHMFLYLPIKSTVTGKTWLNNNLGADYANLNNNSFNLAKQATSKSDYHAYGSLFQWGGKSDGHELTRWTSSGYNYAGQLINSSKYFRWGQNEHNGHWIKTGSDWRAQANGSLWNNEASPNNACPVGYRLPTSNEWKREMGISGYYTYNNSNHAYNTKLKLTVSGFRWGNTVTTHSSLWGYYWSSKASSCRTACALSIYPHKMKVYSWYRGFGFNVRCIED